MFNIFTDAIESTLNTVGDTLDYMVGGEPPKKRDVAKMIDAGLTIAAIAASFGVAEDVISSLIGGDDA